MNLCDTILLLTRPLEASRRFAEAFRTSIGTPADVVISPLMEICLRDPGVDPAGFGSFAFTSANGVTGLAAHLRPDGQAAWCVGPRTAQVAREAGFRVAGTAADVDSLIRTLLAADPAERGQGPFLHAAGRHRRGDLAGQLTAAGLRAETAVVYDQVAQPLSKKAADLLQQECDVAAPVFSPRTTRLLFDAAETRVARLHLVAISGNAAEVWVQRPSERLEIAPTADSDGMTAALGSLFDAYRSA